MSDPNSESVSFDWDAGEVRELIRAALAEDLGSGDVTSEATVAAGARTRGRLLARQPLILAGLPLFERVFLQLDPEISFEGHLPEGASVPGGATVAEMEGNARAILTAERTALNFLAHLSGVATLAGRYVAALAGSRTRLRDTRKTTPLLRGLEKYAVRAAGGTNHRFGLSDGILIKENHIAAAGDVGEAIRRARQAGVTRGLAVEVEVRDEGELREAIGAGPDEILLDNFSPRDAARMVAIARRERPQCRLELSGGITLDTLAEYMRAGADFVSVGAITHSAPAADFSLLVERPEVR